MSDTTIGIAGAISIIILLAGYISYRRRRARMKRLTMELLREYFDGHMPADQFGRKERNLASSHFLQSAEFHSLAIAAFQNAVDAKLATQQHTRENESKLLSLFAALKREFGLTDRYQIEGWRAGRE